MESISSNYSDILEGLLLDNVRQIRKSAIIQHMTDKLDTAVSVASDISRSMSSGGYEFDSNIPEGSTFSIHV